MQDINSVCITGRVCRDPEVRATPSGVSVLNFSVASNRRRKNAQSGQYEDVPGFFDVVVIGSRADGLSKIIHKGGRVAINGYLSYRKWEKDGQRHSRVEIIADYVISYDRQDSAPHVQQQHQPIQEPQQQPNPAQQLVNQYMGAQQQNSEFVYQDEIPF